MRYSCWCDTGIRITETKQSLKLETIGVHDRHSHIGGRMHARKSAPGVGGFSRPESEASTNDESGWWSWNKFSRFINLTLPWAGNERNDLRCVAANFAFELIRAAEPCRPVLEEFRQRGNEKCNDLRQLCGISDTASETDSFQGNRIEVEFVFDGNVHNGVVRCCWLSFPAGCASSNGLGNCAHSVRPRARARRARSWSPDCQWWGTSHVRDFCGVHWSWVCYWTVFRVTTSRRHQDRQEWYCDVEEVQRFCTAHTSGARFFKRRSPDFLQIYLSAGNSPPDRPQRNSPSPACSQHQAPSRCRAHCHWQRKRSCTSGGSSPRPGYAQCPYSTARLEVTVLKQVPRPPSAAYAAGQDNAA